VGAEEGVAVGVGAGVGVGVAKGIFGIGTVRIGDEGVFVGSVGSSSVIVWHPTRMNPTATMP
jgi:hypothetical protein